MALDLLAPDRAGFLEAGRSRMRLWEWGQPSAPPVVLVHGGWDHGRMFDGIAPEIAAMGRHVVAVDLRGHGDSGPLGISGACWLAWNLDLARLLRHLGRPAALIGHSLGGGQVLSVAGAFPEMVTSVVVLDGLGPTPEMMRVDDQGAACAAWLDAAEAVWTGPAREYPSIEAMAARRQTVNIRLSDDWALHLARHGSRPGPNGGLVWKSDPAMRVGGPGPFSEETLRCQFRQIRAPVTALTGGEHDTWSELPDDIIHGRLAAIADSRHRQIAGAGHYLHLEQPGEVLAEVGRLITR
jgi:pimeloyl-ACP methyl ester carboxylesterase